MAVLIRSRLLESRRIYHRDSRPEGAAFAVTDRCTDGQVVSLQPVGSSSRCDLAESKTKRQTHETPFRVVGLAGLSWSGNDGYSG